MSETMAPRSIALLCDAANRVRNVLHNPASLPASPGASVIELFDPGCRDKALRLLQSIRDQRAAFGWELIVRGRGELMLLRFCGASVPDGILLVAAESQPDANALFSRLLQGAEFGDMSHDAPTQQDTLKLYEQIAGLNNQLLSMQRELEKKNADLARLLEDRARIAAMAAHDLRTPLQVIVTATAALEGKLGAQAAEACGVIIAMIRRNADAMRMLVKDLLSAYQADIDKLELSMQPLDVEALVRANAQNNRALAEQKRITLTFSSSRGVPQVLGDPLRLDQAFNNLIHNAIKFSPPGGNVRVSVSGADSWALVSVEDQGMGLGQEQLDALLHGAPDAPQKAGTQSEASYGLGFAIIRSIVGRHHGTIEGESQLGKGARFSVRLPAYAGAGSAMPR
jgi:two-component system, OmpR family, sensor kinase